MKLIRRVSSDRGQYRVSLPMPWAKAHGIGRRTVLTILTQVAGTVQTFTAKVITRAGGLYVTIPRRFREHQGLTHGSPVWLLLEENGTILLQPVEGASVKELERLGLYEYLDRIAQAEQNRDGLIAAIQTRRQFALRSWEIGQELRRAGRTKDRRLARENEILREENARLRALLRLHQDQENP